MSDMQLRKTSIQLVKVDMAFASMDLPHRRLTLLPDLEIANVSHVNLLPGGNRLFVLRGMDLLIYITFRLEKSFSPFLG